MNTDASLYVSVSDWMSSWILQILCYFAFHCSRGYSFSLMACTNSNQ